MKTNDEQTEIINDKEVENTSIDNSVDEEIEDIDISSENDTIENDTITNTENSNDQIIEEGESYSIAEHDEEYLAFSVDGLYSDKSETKYKNSFELRRSAPRLEISTSRGTKVSVPLTYSFNKSMLRVLTEVNNAYLGFKKTKKHFNFGDTNLGVLAKINDWFKSIRLSVLEIFLGILIGISLTNNFVIGVIGLIAIEFVLLMFHYSANNNKKQEEKNNE